MLKKNNFKLIVVNRNRDAGGKWPGRLELFIYPFILLLECWVSPSPVGCLVKCPNTIWLIRGKSTTYCTTVLERERAATFPRNGSTSMSNGNGLNSQEKGHLDPATRVESKEIEDVKSEFGDETTCVTF